MADANQEKRRATVFERMIGEERQSYTYVTGHQVLPCSHSYYIKTADEFAVRLFEKLGEYESETERRTEFYTSFLDVLAVECIQRQVISPIATRFEVGPELGCLIMAAKATDDVGRISNILAVGSASDQPTPYQVEFAKGIILSALSSQALMKGERRARRQCSDRRYKEASGLLEARCAGRRYLGVLQMQFFLTPGHPNPDDAVSVAHFRGVLLKDWKKKPVFDGVLDYVWIIEPDWIKGAVLSCFFFIDIENGANPAVVANNIGYYWNVQATRGAGSHWSNANIITHAGVSQNPNCALDVTDSFAVSRVLTEIRYRCDRDMYLRLKGSIVKECFGHGSVGASHWLAKKSQVEREGKAIAIPFGKSSLVEGFHSSVESSEILDSLGIYLGFDYASTSGVFHRPAALANGHMVTLGPTGSGKTTGLLNHCNELLSSGIPIAVLDPHNQALAKLPIKSCVISNGANAFGINPLKLYFKEWGKRGLDGQIDEKVKLINQCAGNGLGHREKDIIKSALRELYARSGLGVDPPGKQWKCPKMEQLIGLLEKYSDDLNKKDDKKSIAGAMAALRANFGNRVFNQESFVEAKDCLIGKGLHFDLSGLEGHEKGMVGEAFLLDAWHTCREMGALPEPAKNDAERFRLFIIVDEAHLLNMGRNPNAKGSILDTLIREGRKFGICIVLATQSIDDLSDTVRKNAAAWMVFRLNDDAEARILARKFRVLPDAFLGLKNACEALYFDGRRPTASRVDLDRYKGGSDDCIDFAEVHVGI